MFPNVDMNKVSQVDLIMYRLMYMSPCLIVPITMEVLINIITPIHCCYWLFRIAQDRQCWKLQSSLNGITLFMYCKGSKTVLFES